MELECTRACVHEYVRTQFLVHAFTHRAVYKGTQSYKCMHKSVRLGKCGHEANDRNSKRLTYQGHDMKLQSLS